MKLNEILALRPASGDSTVYKAAIGKAETLRADLVARAAHLESVRANGLLTLGDKEIKQAAEEATQARLDVDRIESLLPAIHADLAQVAGRETLDDLRGQVAAYAEQVEALRGWVETDLPKLNEVFATGMRLENIVVEGRRQIELRMQDEYRRQEVRDAGPLDIDWPELPALPSSTFGPVAILKSIFGALASR